MFTISWKQCWQLFPVTWFPSNNPGSYLIETVVAIISVVQICSFSQAVTNVVYVSAVSAIFFQLE